MSSISITKEALANALVSLLSEQPLNKISIKDITDFCNISRNTFYYHFKDKYELINWIFYTDMQEQVDYFKNPAKLNESFVNVCKVLYANRKFYLACFQYTGQNSLYEYIFDYYYGLWKINLGDTQCSSSRPSQKISEAELNIMAKMKTHSMLGMITDWVRDGMRDNYMTYFEQMRSILEREVNPFTDSTNIHHE